MLDISLIMNFHAEDVLAHWSLLGFQRMREFASHHGVSVQLVAVLDRASQTTRR
ncbi:glycosyltransferase family 2 protein, partial [Pseudomonas aeruginosa]|nr:glycosyltransferase family 2 protein [Pseudomonas aeruginosa]